MSTVGHKPQELTVVPAAVVSSILGELGKEGARIVETVYRQAARGELVNPDSLFLRPDPSDRRRAIALPAYVAGETPAMGLKWISSFPENLERGLPRASALITLNDVATGFPRAVLEGARISAFRTALSATVGARALRGGDLAIRRMAVVGTGYIADATVQAMAEQGWRCGSVAVHDLDEERARSFAASHTHGITDTVTIQRTLRATLQDADLVLFATTAVEPYVGEADWFCPGAVVLHMSLRDLKPAAMSGAEHIVDEISHALREKTSLALALDEGIVQRADITNIGDHLDGRIHRKPDKTAVYAPFGLGSLDIAVAALVLQHALGNEGVITVPDFSGASTR